MVEENTWRECTGYLDEREREREREDFTEVERCKAENGTSTR